MSKRALPELIDTQEPAIELLRQLATEAEVPSELLPPGPERENALLYLQVQRDVSTAESVDALLRIAYDEERARARHETQPVPAL